MRINKAVLNGFLLYKTDNYIIEKNVSIKCIGVIFISLGLLNWCIHH